MVMVMAMVSALMVCHLTADCGGILVVMTAVAITSTTAISAGITIVAVVAVFAVAVTYGL